MNRAIYNAGSIALKLIANFSAFVVAGILAGLTNYIATVYFNNVVDIAIPPSMHVFATGFLLRDPDMAVLCSILLPVGIALWWQKPIAPPLRVRACLLGIAAGFVPIMFQVLTRPFIFQSYQASATTAAAAIFSSIVISTEITLNTIQRNPLANVIPYHVKRGLLRGYLAVMIPLIVVSGYTIFTAQNLIKFQQKQLSHLYELRTERLQCLLKRLEDNGDKRNASDNAEWPPGYAPKTGARLHGIESCDTYSLMRVEWDARTNKEIKEHIEKAIRQNEDQLTVSVYALLVGLLLGVCYPVFIWIIAGFRREGESALHN